MGIHHPAPNACQPPATGQRCAGGTNLKPDAAIVDAPFLVHLVAELKAGDDEKRRNKSCTRGRFNGVSGRHTTVADAANAYSAQQSECSGQWTCPSNRP